MIKTVNISIYFLLLILLNSCGSVSDVGKVLRNEKTRTTDEFFVKKREPLSLPPDYKTLPEPNTQKKNSEETIDKILSDDKIVDILNAEGIDVDRRTVAKYREALGLASSVQRRREKNSGL